MEILKSKIRIILLSFKVEYIVLFLRKINFQVGFSFKIIIMVLFGSISLYDYNKKRK